MNDCAKEPSAPLPGRLVPRQKRGKGHSLQAHEVFNIETSLGQKLERAKNEGVSESTVRRVDKRVLEHEDCLHPSIVSSNRPKLLDPVEAAGLFWFKEQFPTSTISACIKFVKVGFKKEVSDHLIRSELKEMGFNTKRFAAISTLRDENDRVKYWTNGPTRCLWS